MTDVLLLADKTQPIYVSKNDMSNYIELLTRLTSIIHREVIARGKVLEC